MASYLQSLPELDEDLLEPITPPSPDADSESEESEADDSNQPSQKKRRGADKEYAQWQEFPSVEAYNEFWQTEKAEWRYNNTHEISDGDVKIWHCRYRRLKGYFCPKVLRAFFPADSESVVLSVSVDDHCHQPTEMDKASALSKPVKDFIDAQLKNDLTAARIHAVLSKEEWVAKVPTLTQVQNYVKRQRGSLDGPFTDDDLVTYCADLTEVPDDENTPFILGWSFNNNNNFFVLWTTRKLLQMQKVSKQLQADSTHCLNWLSYPVPVLGYSDANRRFQPTAMAVGPSEDAAVYTSVFGTLKNANYEPEVILGDGSPALTKAVETVFPDASRIMCYAHVFRRVSAHLKGKPKELQDLIKKDIDLLRFARSEEEFLKLAELMIASWPPEAADFADYFLATWVHSKESKWYEGASIYVCNNNGLESANKQIKEAHTLRKKLPFKRFLKVVESIVAYWSMHAQSPPAMPTVAPQIFKTAYTDTGAPGSTRYGLKLRGNATFVYSSGASNYRDAASVKQALKEHAKEPSSWEDFRKSRFDVYVVTKSPLPDTNHFACSCREGARKRVCKHAVAVMCRADVGLLEYPPDATAQPLAQLGKKRGRPTQGRPALAQKQSRFAAAD